MANDREQFPFFCWEEIFVTLRQQRHAIVAFSERFRVAFRDGAHTMDAFRILLLWDAAASIFFSSDFFDRFYGRLTDE